MRGSSVFAAFDWLVRQICDTEVRISREIHASKIAYWHKNSKMDFFEFENLKRSLGLYNSNPFCFICGSVPYLLFF